ncbi:hypothetical protein [Staphylococcus aureus]|uniref:hypothetical protein n=1 Tax=Staphylococcus aureus TaxID=1280 RepID=UPI0004B491CC|nr:hypothetical protein [Staphylococcus aureus]HEA6159838.1 hypothetical protein [Staphylococcus aureus]
MTDFQTVCHGTNKKIYEEIQNDNHVLIPNYKDDNRLPNDLGDGIYFFGNNNRFKANICAEKYARRYKNKDSDHITLLFYELDMNDDYTLDLDDEEHKTNFIEKREQLNYQLRTMIKNYNCNLSRGQLDGLLINLMNNSLSGTIKIVKKETFTQFDDIYKSSNFPNALEICVKDNSLLTFKNSKHMKIKG